MDIAIIFGLILLNGVFAMSEIAIVSSKHIRLKQDADDGHAGAKRALQLAENPSRFLSTIQVGITLIGILAGAFGESSIADRLQAFFMTQGLDADVSKPLAWTLMVIVITYFSLIFGELVPKRLALMNPEFLAKNLARPMDRLSTLTHPLVWFLSASTDLILKLLRVKKRDEDSIIEEEIESLVTQGTAAGILETAEHDMLKNVLKLDEQRVGSIMTMRKEMVFIDIEKDNDSIRHVVAHIPHARIPVCRGSVDNVIGVLCKKEYLSAHVRGDAGDIVSMLKPALYIPRYSTTLDLLGQFKTFKAHLAIVTDEEDKTCGVVSLTDVMTAIVGTVATEESDYEPDFIARDDGSWLVSGQVDIKSFKDKFGIKTLPDEDAAGYHTLAGAVLAVLDRVPREGEVLLVGHLRLEIVDMDGHRLDKVLVSWQEQGDLEAQSSYRD